MSKLHCSNFKVRSPSSLSLYSLQIGKSMYYCFFLIFSCSQEKKLSNIIQELQAISLKNILPLTDSTTNHVIMIISKSFIRIFFLTNTVLFSIIFPFGHFFTDHLLFPQTLHYKKQRECCKLLHGGLWNTQGKIYLKYLIFVLKYACSMQIVKQ